MGMIAFEIKARENWPILLRWWADNLQVHGEHWSCPEVSEMFDHTSGWIPPEVLCKWALNYEGLDPMARSFAFWNPTAIRPLGFPDVFELRGSDEDLVEFRIRFGD